MQSRVLLLACLLLAPVSTVAGERAEAGQPPILVKLHKQLTISLHKLDTDLSQAATQFASVRLPGREQSHKLRFSRWENAG